MGKGTDRATITKACSYCNARAETPCPYRQGSASQLDNPPCTSEDAAREWLNDPVNRQIVEILGG